jgi:phage shock protein PspC (stress-responsive transcriptional regulator)
MDTETNNSVPRRLHRRSDDRVVAGVAGGLADYTGVDPILFRIGFILLALAGASGILLYGLAWLVIPEEGQAPVGRSFTGRYRGRRWLAVVLLIIGLLFVSEWVQIGDMDWTLIWAIALVAVGFVLLRDEPTREPAAAAETGTARPVPDQIEARPRRRRRPRSPLGFMTLGATFVVLAMASMLMASDTVELDPGQFMALIVMTLGAGLVVGAWWGRARLLVLLAMFLVPVMVAASMVDVPLKGSITSPYTLIKRKNVEPEYRLLAGTMTLDFSTFDFGETPTEVDVAFAVGDVEIYVPPGVEVEVNGEVDLGVADLFGEGQQGRDLQFGDSFQRDGLTEGSLVVNVDGGLGSFDTTWAHWADRHIRDRERHKRRQERKEEQKKDERREAKRDGRNRDRN